MNYYLRLEGVNLANFIYDTNDLSTVRGGSFLLLDAVQVVAELQEPVTLTPISTGASLGLFQFEVPDNETPESAECLARTVCDAVKQALNTHDQLQHATFVVDIQADTGHYEADREALLARIRWRQWQQPTVAVPTYQDKPTTHCEVDRLRPAVTTRPGPEQKREHISASVAARSEYGRQYKQKFYRRETRRDDLDDMEFAYDFKELTLTKAAAFRNLNQKMAVIYLDGNGFGKLRDRTCTSADLQRQFDQHMKVKRSHALAALLDSMRADSSWRSDNGRYRIETLLWGGDEILWVVPAWQGWQTLKLFYEQSNSWTWAEEPLRHAGGIVFCHHNAPIYRIKSLAVELSDLAKACRVQNQFAYMVLESFDHIGKNLETSLQERYGTSQTCILKADDMSSIEIALSSLKPMFPSGKLHWIVHRLQREPDKAKYELDRVIAALDETGKEAWQMLRNCFADDLHAACYNFAELWDYVGKRGSEDA